MRPQAWTHLRQLLLRYVHDMPGQLFYHSVIDMEFAPEWGDLSTFSMYCPESERQQGFNYTSTLADFGNHDQGHGTGTAVGQVKTC